MPFINFYVMPRLVPNKFKSDIVNNILTIDTRRDKLGNVFYYLEFSFEGKARGYRFEYLSSVIDFISSNFK